MGIYIIRNGRFLPHQAIILTKKHAFPDFKLEKIINAYQKRKLHNVKNSIWELEVHPVNFCQLKCNGCSYGSRHSGMVINFDRLIDLVNYYNKSDLKTIFFSGGGDPSGWNRWEDFVERVEHNRSWHIGTSTNLYNLSNMKNILNKIDFYQIHVVGYDKESTIQECGLDVFSSIDNNIKTLFERRKDNQTITMKFLMRNQNYTELNYYINYLEQFDCDSIVIKLEQNFLENKTLNGAINLQQVRETLKGSHILSKYDYLLDNLDDPVFNNPIPRSCYIAATGLYALLRTNGDLFPCVASPYDNKNAYCNINITSDYSNHLDANYYDLKMKNKVCPLKACRHYRFDSIIENYLNNKERRLEDVNELEPTLL
ncbi:radical SAM protein [Propionispora vibrioides]|uniref:Radical SAM superfamily protein n=1 Tax=Propionispora vibrioides TaxID=112903 RepID=A0A1H8XMC6_9FIRM|nr:radical SAM protein [Propionispora vibrioides]SEP40947.1 Radical SAM superfamily protein [Propionispora vibrioides]